MSCKNMLRIETYHSIGGRTLASHPTFEAAAETRQHMNRALTTNQQALIYRCQQCCRIIIFNTAIS